MASTDFIVAGGGSIYILNPVTREAADWCDAHLPEDAMRWGRSGYVVEHRYIGDIVDGIRADGLVVS